MPLAAIKYKKGASIKGISAQDAFDELERIRAEHDGELRKEHIVEASVPEDAVFHEHFEWDNDKAAEKYRSHQAGSIVRAIVVYNPAKPSDEGPVYISVVDEESSDRFYATISEVMTDEDRRVQVVQDALRSLNGWRKRYGYLREVQPIIEQIETIERRAVNG